MLLMKSKTSTDKFNMKSKNLPHSEALIPYPIVNHNHCW